MPETRRRFLQHSALGLAAFAVARATGRLTDAQTTAGAAPAGAVPWYRRTLRWARLELASILDHEVVIIA